MLLRQDWLEDLSTRGKTQQNGGEFRSETRRSTLEGLKVAEIGQPRSPLSGDYPWNIVETPHRRRCTRGLVQDKGACFAVSLNNRPQLAVVYHATAVAGFVAANKLL